MIEFGLATFKREYSEEINLAKSLGFSFFQIWFYNGKMCVETLPEPKEKAIKEAQFPIIIHAVFDMPDYEMYGEKFLNLIDYFGNSEVIIHPICEKEKITANTILVFKNKIEAMNQKLSKRKIKLYLENNAIIGGFFNTVDHLKIIFDSNPDIGLLLDLAHINDYDHLKEIVKMRYPECIHIADKHFGIAHEHIALGKGDLDFEMIFTRIIPKYDGKIILEANNSINEVKKSKEILDNLFGKQLDE